ncbi:DSS1/SEM1 [Dillenia turbinata]|uniref:26S proteasome complex subunit SEM1 n=1 Tax=Dillenia turbinata TaxID=194707 RepID=A0AAN8V183_9MAGN
MRVGIMAAEPKATTEEAKIDLFEDDDEFEEFEIDEGDISVLVLALILTCYSKLIANLLTIATTYLMVALIDEWEDKEATKEVIQQWEDDWDDDDVNDDFSLQLRRELEGPAFQWSRPGLIGPMATNYQETPKEVGSARARRASPPLLLSAERMLPLPHGKLP